MGWGCPDHPSQRLMYKTHDDVSLKVDAVEREYAN